MAEWPAERVKALCVLLILAAIPAYLVTGNMTVAALNPATAVGLAKWWEVQQNE